MPALHRVVVLSVLPGLADFHGNVSDPKLMLYVGGNHFFAVAALVAALEQQHPEFKGRICWETLPPGLLVKQIAASGTVGSGNMTWTAKPDAYFAGLKKVHGLINDGVLNGPAVPYATNSLTIMVPASSGWRPGASALGGYTNKEQLYCSEWTGVPLQTER